jgi:CheY-like chemotaxis protein
MMEERPSTCVLIVEDDRDVRLSLAEVLAEEGYRIAMAGNGLEALRYLRSASAPGVILLDLMMPVMDGWEFLSVQRQIPSLSSIPVIVLTAGGTLKGPTSPVPVIDRLKKPVEMQNLLDVVKRACDRYRLS